VLPPELNDGAGDARAVVAVDDRDDELRRLVAQGPLRQRAMEAERRRRVHCALAGAAACGGKPYEQEQDP
jgi:predicted short-subunit dehydrogenase-like oxidoreductase (DUF2520 family)